MRSSASTPGSEIRCLLYANVAPGRPYHAALSSTEGASARGYRVTEHTHDFYEMVYVLAGDALHGVNGGDLPMRAGDLFLLHPGDRHDIRFRAGRPLHYINIAMHAAMWRSFHELAEIPTSFDAPQAINVFAAGSTNDCDDCTAAFQRALVRFQDTRITNAALRTEACRLLATVALWFSGIEDREGHMDGDPNMPERAPAWLITACRKLQQDSEALRCGLPAFVAEAGVTRTHLARVLKTATGQTPTGYVNRLRLERAARLLTTTTLTILEVAGECGFENPAYFYRLFQARFQTSPHAYRTAAARRVTPRFPA